MANLKPCSVLQPLLSLSLNNNKICLRMTSENSVKLYPATCEPLYTVKFCGKSKNILAKEEEGHSEAGHACKTSQKCTSCAYLTSVLYSV